MLQIKKCHKRTLMCSIFSLIKTRGRLEIASKNYYLYSLSISPCFIDVDKNLFPDSTHLKRIYSLISE